MERLLQAVAIIGALVVIDATLKRWAPRVRAWEQMAARMERRAWERVMVVPEGWRSQNMDRARDALGKTRDRKEQEGFLKSRTLSRMHRP